MNEDLRDVIISVSKETRMTNFDKHVIGNDGENLQGNLVFKFTDEFVDGVGRLEYTLDGTSNYMLVEKYSDDDESYYYIPIKNVITKTGYLYMQFVVTEAAQETSVPVFKSNQFYMYVGESINAVTEAPEGYDLWIETANAKIIEIDNAIATAATEIEEMSTLEETVSTNEENRNAAETARANAETARATAESARANAETTRTSNEEGRVSRETSRISSEESRVTAELARVKAEQGRVSAEEKRETTFATYEETINNLKARLDEYDKYDYLVLEGGN